MFFTTAHVELPVDRQAVSDLQPRDSISRLTVPQWAQQRLQPVIAGFLQASDQPKPEQILVDGDEIIVKLVKPGHVVVRTCYLSICDAIATCFDPAKYEVKIRLFHDDHHWWDDLPRWARHPRDTMLENPLRLVTVRPRSI